MARRLVTLQKSAGISRDISHLYLPGSTFTNGRNVRFQKGKTDLMGGVLAMMNEAETANVLWVGFANGLSKRYYLFSDGVDVWSYDGTNVAEITKAATSYTSTADNMWMIENFNGLQLLNNGLDLPQTWDPSVATNLLANLVNWDTDFRAGVIRGFKSYLIAGNLKDGSTEYPHDVMWSHPADPGAWPASWDYTDPTKDAGRFSLTDTKYGGIVNMLPMGNYNYIYKEGSIWAMYHVGGQKIFAIDPVPSQGAGLKCKHSLVTIPSKVQGRVVQFFADENAFYVMDGAGVYPIFEETFQNEIVSLRDPDNYPRSFAVHNPIHSELWFCIPERGSGYCTLAFVWDYKYNTYSIKELSGTLSIASGLGFNPAAAQVEVDLKFDDLTLFDDLVGFYSLFQQPSRNTIVEASYTLDNLFYLEMGTLSYDGTTYISGYVERKYLGNIGERGGEPEIDYNLRKLIGCVIPMDLEGTLSFQVGVSETDKVNPVYSTDIVTDATKWRYDLPVPVSGKFVSFKFKSVANQGFSFGGFGYELDVLGEN